MTCSQPRYLLTPPSLTLSFSLYLSLYLSPSGSTSLFLCLYLSSLPHSLSPSSHQFVFDGMQIIIHSKWTPQSFEVMLTDGKRVWKGESNRPRLSHSFFSSSSLFSSFFSCPHSLSSLFLNLFSLAPLIFSLQSLPPLTPPSHRKRDS